MAWNNQAQQSYQNLFSGALPTTLTAEYTAPAVSSNLTGTSSTTVVKEIVLCNITSSPANVSLEINGVYVLNNTPLAANSPLVLSLNTGMPAGNTIQAMASAANIIHCNISGMVLQ